MTFVTAAGGVLYRKGTAHTEVLLIYRNDVWDLPKGKMEEGETPRQCAQREVAEEVGIGLPQVEDKLVQTYHEYKRAGTQYGKTTHWFAMQTDAQAYEPQEAEGITQVAWIALDEAEKRVGFNNLQDVLAAFKKYLQ